MAPLRSKLSSAILEQGRELGPSDRLVMQATLNHPVRALHTRGDEFPECATSEAVQSPEALSGLEDRPQRFTDRRGLYHTISNPRIVPVPLEKVWVSIPIRCKRETCRFVRG